MRTRWDRQSLENVYLRIPSQPIVSSEISLIEQQHQNRIINDIWSETVVKIKIYWVIRCECIDRLVVVINISSSTQELSQLLSTQTTHGMFNSTPQQSEWQQDPEQHDTTQPT